MIVRHERHEDGSEVYRAVLTRPELRALTKAAFTHGTEGP